MCEFSGKWVAWMDGELPAGEAAEIKQHLECCAECRGGTGAYKRVSEEIVVYCDHVFATEMREWSPQSVALASAVGAIAALIVLIVVWPRTHVPQHEFEGSQAVATTSAAGTRTADPAITTSGEIVRSARGIGAAEKRSARKQHVHSGPTWPEIAVYSLPNEPMVQIAISAEEMFPPGAVPAGMNFVADLAIAADGSAERLQLRPRFAGFERSTIQP